MKQSKDCLLDKANEIVCSSFEDVSLNSTKTPECLSTEF